MLVVKYAVVFGKFYTSASVPDFVGCGIDVLAPYEVNFDGVLTACESFSHIYVQVEHRDG